MRGLKKKKSLKGLQNIWTSSACFIAGRCILYLCAGHRSCAGLFCVCTARFRTLAKAISLHLLYSARV